MAQFDCCECGKTLRIEKVETHLRKCGSSSVNCMFCAREFFEDEFKAHTQCEEAGEMRVERSPQRESDYSPDERSRESSRQEHRQRSRSGTVSVVELEPSTSSKRKMSRSRSRPDDVYIVSEDKKKLYSDIEDEGGQKKQRKRRRYEESDDVDGKSRRRHKKSRHSGRKTANPRRLRRFVKRLTANGPISLAELAEAFEIKFSRDTNLLDFADLIMVNEVLSGEISSSDEKVIISDDDSARGEFREDHSNSKRKKKPCFNYERGNCRFGENCHYLHTSYRRTTPIAPIHGAGELMGGTIPQFNQGNILLDGAGRGEFIPNGIEAPATMGAGNICIPFRAGQCMFGDNCRLVHDLGPPPVAPVNPFWIPPTGVGLDPNFITPQRPKPCFNFLKGFCAFGDRCRYIHQTGLGIPVPMNGRGGFVRGRGRGRGRARGRGHIRGRGQGRGRGRGNGPNFAGPVKKKPCFNFAKGHCSFGEDCRYLHQKEDGISQNSSDVIKDDGIPQIPSDVI